MRAKLMHIGSIVEVPSSRRSMTRNGTLQVAGENVSTPDVYLGG